MDHKANQKKSAPGDKFRNFRVEFPNMPVSPEYGLPMAYGTPEANAVIEGEVVLECNYECKAVDFKAGCCVTGRVAFGEANALANQRVDTCDDAVIPLTLTLTLPPPPRPPRNPDRVLPGIHRLPFSFPINRNHPTAFKTLHCEVSYVIKAWVDRGPWSSNLFYGSFVYINNTTIPAPRPPQLSLKAPLVIDDDAHLMRISGMWSQIQPFEILYKHATVHWSQQMPITIRIFPPLFAPNHNAQITLVAEMEMVMLERTLMKGHFADQKRQLSKEVPRELISGHWRPFMPGQIWSAELLVDVPAEKYLLPTVKNIPFLKIDFEVHVHVSCLTQDGRRIKLAPFLPLEVTGPRPPGDKMPTLEEELMEHELQVDRFTTVPVLDFSKSTRLANSSPFLGPVRCKISV